MLKRQFLAFFFCLIATFNQLHAGEAALRLSNATLPPVTLPGGDGLIDRIASEMFHRAQLSFELKRFPPARGLAMANAGAIDGELARINISNKRFSNLLKVTEPILSVKFAGLYMDKERSISTIDDFNDFRVGYIRGWVIAETLFSEHTNATATANADQLMDMLIANRFDIAFMTVTPARFLARERGVEGLKVTQFQKKKDLFLYLHKNHKEKIPVLSSALRSMKTDGSHDAIVSEFRKAYQ